MDGPQVVRRPLVSAAIGFTFGVLAAPAGAVGADAFAAVVLTALIVTLARRGRVLSALLLPLPFFFAGLVVASLRLPPAETITSQPGRLGRQGVLLEGVVVEAPRQGPDHARLIIDVTGTSTAALSPLSPAHGRIALWVARATDENRPCAQAGERVRAWARLSRPTPALLPGGGSGRLLAARQGIALFGSARSHAHCVSLGPAVVSGPRVAMERLRGSVHAAIARGLPTDTAPIVRAFATGDRSGISRTVDRQFQASGLSHLLAVSGLNLAIIAGLFVLGLALLFRRFERITLGFGALRLAAAIAIPFVVAYTLLVGATPSAVRAALMTIALLVAHLSRRVTEPWTALAIALIVMLAYDPTTLGDPSFQLSFAAVAALFRIYPALRERLAPNLSHWPWWRRWPVEVALASAAATIGTAPLVARHFQRVSLIGLVANVPAAPLASIILVPLSLAGGLIGQLSDTAAAPVLWLAGAAAKALVGLAAAAADIPGASLRVPRPSVFECVLFYGGTIGLSIKPVTRRTRRFGIACLIALALVMAGAQASRRLQSNLRVAFLPVGQGDGIVAELPGGKVLVVDTGPAYGSISAAERIVGPYLRRRRIMRIDYLVLTHPHADHVGGLAALAQSFPIGEVWWTGDRREAESAMLAPIAHLVAKTVTASTAPVRVGDVTIGFLGPVTSADAHPIVNDGSVVLRLAIGDRAILLAGDAERSAEQALVTHHGAALRSDVLKAGHHGSRTSSTEALLGAVQPQHVIFTVGRDNRFGFPHPEVVERVAATGAAMWRTDHHGLIVVETDGDTLTVAPFRKGSTGAAADQPRAAATSAP